MSRRWALFLSGRGSTAQALLDLIGDLDIRMVISSRKKVEGVLRARRAGVPVHFFGQKDSWKELSRDLKAAGIDSIFLVGFMRILPGEFVEEWSGRIFNVHPSLLPAYPGLDAMIISFEKKAKMGVTVHQVTEQMDAGPVCLQSCVEPAPDWQQTQLRMARMEQRLLREWASRLPRRVLR